MAPTKRTKTALLITTAADRSSPTRQHQSARVRDRDIARCAYGLYLARGCEHGHDVDDWLQAERELHDATTVIAG
jgi:hypothetical protein